MAKVPLVRCPNYSVCQSMVLASKAGDPHKYGVYDSIARKIVYKDCNG